MMVEKRGIMFVTVSDINVFRSNIDPNKEDRVTTNAHNQLIDDPEMWWNINCATNAGSENKKIDIPHDIVQKNSVEIEEWIRTSIGYTVVAVPHIKTTKTDTTIKVKEKSAGGLFSLSKEVEVDKIVTEVDNEILWCFWFRRAEDATLFKLTWLG